MAYEDTTERMPPESYESLIRVIHDRYDKMSASFRKIAIYLTQNPNDVAILPLKSISTNCGVHASGLVRCAQSLGYGGFRELQAVFQRRLVVAAPGFGTRLKVLEEELGVTQERNDESFLRGLVARDIVSLEALLTDISGEDISKAVELMEKAQTIYLIGQLRSAPITQLLRYVLTMLGKRAICLNPSGGLATHMAKLIRRDDLLLAISFPYYATEVVDVVEETAAKGTPIVAISDSSFSPLARNANVLFEVPEREYTFSRSIAAPMCLAQGLTVTLASHLQGARAPRIPIVTER